MKRDLLKLLASIDEEWKQIAEGLNVPAGKIKGLERNNQSYISKLSDALQIWIDMKSSDVTWENIIDVVDSPPVSKTVQAQAMRDFLEISKNYERYMNEKK